MTRDEARAFADEWAAAWNERAVERVLSHFDDDVSFTSPTALAVVGVATVRGKQALREYWNTALARINSLRFAVERVSGPRSRAGDHLRPLRVERTGRRPRLKNGP